MGRCVRDRSRWWLCVTLPAQARELAGRTARRGSCDDAPERRTAQERIRGLYLVTAHSVRDGQDVSVREVNVWHLADGKATEFWDFAEDNGTLDRMFG